jgi:hypothetical protein
MPFDSVLCFSWLFPFDPFALVNWFSGWFAYSPDPPLEVFERIDSMLGFFDPGLLLHFEKHNILPQVGPAFESAYPDSISFNDGKHADPTS